MRLPGSGRRGRRRSAIGEWLLRRRLARRVLALLARATVAAPPQGERQEDRYTTIDRQHALEGEATRRLLDVGEGRALGRPRAKSERMQAKRRTLARRGANAQAKSDRSAGAAAAFGARFVRAPELLVAARAWLVPLVYLAIAGLLGLDYELNLPAFAFLTPSGAATSTLAGVRSDVLAALAFTVAQGVLVKLAGKHAAWSLSRLVVRADVDRGGAYVASDWSRGEHGLMAALVGALAIASVVVIVQVRVPALNVAADFGSDPSGGILGDAGAARQDSVGAGTLTLISLVPLLAAAFLGGFVESPLRSCHRRLAADAKRDARRARRLARWLDRLDGRLGKLWLTIRRIAREFALERHSVGVEVAHRHELMAESAPDFFGYYTRQRPAGYDDMAGAIAAADELADKPIASVADELREAFDDGAAGASEQPNPAVGGGGERPPVNGHGDPDHIDVGSELRLPDDASPGGDGPSAGAAS